MVGVKCQLVLALVSTLNGYLRSSSIESVWSPFSRSFFCEGGKNDFAKLGTNEMRLARTSSLLWNPLLFFYVREAHNNRLSTSLG